jgi:hypothetical protein
MSCKLNRLTAIVLIINLLITFGVPLNLLPSARASSTNLMSHTAIAEAGSSLIPNYPVLVIANDGDDWTSDTQVVRLELDNGARWFSQADLTAAVASNTVITVDDARNPGTIGSNLGTVTVSVNRMSSSVAQFTFANSAPWAATTDRIYIPMLATVGSALGENKVEVIKESGEIEPSTSLVYAVGEAASSHMPIRATSLDLTAVGTDRSSAREGWSWSNASKTLTLSGANIQASGAGNETGIKLPGGSTITLTAGTTNLVRGSDAAAGESYGVYGAGNLTINGSGTLIATGGNAPVLSCGILAENALSVTSSRIIATGGDNSALSYGLYSAYDGGTGGILLSGATLRATGGRGSDGATSYGIYSVGGAAASDIQILSSSHVTAIGGSFPDAVTGGIEGHVVAVEDSQVYAMGGSGTDASSCGISSDDFSLDGGELTAIGGSGRGSFGLAASANFSVTDGTITGLGGTTTHSVSIGITYGMTSTIFGGNVTGIGGSSPNLSGGMDGRNLTINGGTVTATGTDGRYSYGISSLGGDLIVNGGVLVASGGTATDYSYGIKANSPDIQLDGGVTIARSGLAPSSKAMDLASVGALTDPLTGVVDGDKVPTGNYVVYADNSGGIYKVRTDQLQCINGAPAGVLDDDGYHWNGTDTLTLKNLILNTAHSTGINLPVDATLQLQGTSVIRSGDVAGIVTSVGLGCLGNLSVGGAGSAYVFGGNSSDNGSEGFSINGTADFGGTGTVYGCGGAAGATSAGDSMGFSISGATISIASGKIIALGGSANSGLSKGIYGKNLSVGGGQLYAVGGTTAGVAADESRGIDCVTLDLSNGSTVAIGGTAPSWLSSGVYASGNVYTSGANTKLTAIGGTGRLSSGIYSTGPKSEFSGCTINAFGGTTTAGESNGILVDEDIEFSGASTQVNATGGITSGADYSNGIKTEYGHIVVLGGNITGVGQSNGVFAIDDSDGRITVSDGSLFGLSRLFYGGLGVSCGIISHADLLISGGSVVGIGGTSDISGSQGIFVGTEAGEGVMLSAGKLIAVGGTAQWSSGVATKKINMTGGTLTAAAGAADGESRGIWEPGVGDFVVAGGTLATLGGAGTSESFGFTGGANLTINGGKLLAATIETLAAGTKQAMDDQPTLGAGIAATSGDWNQQEVVYEQVGGTIASVAAASSITKASGVTGAGIYVDETFAGSVAATSTFVLRLPAGFTWADGRSVIFGTDTFGAGNSVITGILPGTDGRDLQLRITPGAAGAVRRSAFITPVFNVGDAAAYGDVLVQLIGGGDVTSASNLIIATYPNPGGSGGGGSSPPPPELPPLPLLFAPVITTDSLPAGSTQAAYNQTLTATGTTPITWSVSGSLPPGLSLNAQSGTISGTPTKDGTYSFTVQARNAGGSDSRTLDIVIATGMPVIIYLAPSYPSPSVARVRMVAWECLATGSKLTYRFEVILDDKVVQTREYNSSMTFEWTPQTAGEYKVKVYVKDSASGLVATKTSEVYTVVPDTNYSVYFWRSQHAMESEARVRAPVTTVPQLPQPSLQGFIFKGWYTDKGKARHVTPPYYISNTHIVDDSFTEFTTGTAITHSPYNVYAKWEIADPTVTYLALSQLAYCTFSKEMKGYLLTDLIKKGDLDVEFRMYKLNFDGLLFPDSGAAKNLFLNSLYNWEYLDVFTKEQNVAFNAAAFRNRETDEIVIAYTGSAGLNPSVVNLLEAIKTKNFSKISLKDIATLTKALKSADITVLTEDPNDWINNFFAFQLGMMDKFGSGMFWQSQLYYDYVTTMNRGYKQITLTGHSQGGALANYVAQRNGERARTFNAPSGTFASYYNQPEFLGRYFSAFNQDDRIDYVILQDFAGNMGIGDNAYWTWANGEQGGNLDRTFFFNVDDQFTGRYMNAADTHNLFAYPIQSSTCSLGRLVAAPSRKKAFSIVTELANRGLYLGSAENDDFDSFFGRSDKSLLMTAEEAIEQAKKSIAKMVFGLVKGEDPVAILVNDLLVVVSGKIIKSLFAHNTIYGGDGNDRLMGDRLIDRLIGGRGEDVLDGYKSNDKYYYFIDERSNDGLDTIEDLFGDDNIYIISSLPVNALSFYWGEVYGGKLYTRILLNNKFIMRVNENRSGSIKVFILKPDDAADDAEKVAEEMREIIFKNGRIATIKCPVNVEVKGADGKSLLTFGDKPDVKYTPEGNFYAYQEDGVSGLTKVCALAGGQYSLMMHGTGTGKMDFSLALDDGNGQLVNYVANNIPITPDTKVLASLDEAKGLYLAMNPDENGHSDTIIPLVIEGLEQKEANESDNGTEMQFFLNQKEYLVNGEKLTMDVAPVSILDRTMLPVRYITTPLQATASWDKADSKTTIVMGGRTIELWNGRNRAMVDGVATAIDPENAAIKPIILPPGRIMLPLRFITETLGCKVTWDAAEQKITITGPGRVPEVGAPDVPAE